ncbi:hypothetical protein LTR10_023705 [Elasticomyces elasticus]|uniref:Fungal lipase-like domain-containing protein n=1 Tax=Exophiala sideris TaxID=1016849 RepID=A0ABR0JPA2_9EURO|nr:hypothetical protein LTR10_023705 [Elasticomyces elasticus]KAK5067811.1 hypothetical protein LTR69_001800 [Exophiala sideris]KAK5183948.1 hypothetical protein LTR44_003453 [Eurotiomycetes sp. CCFEE 6388]
MTCIQSVLAYAVFILSLAYALPLTSVKRAISEDLLEQFSLFEQYSGAAYCPGNNDASTSAAITCSAGNCPLVQAAGAQSIVEFENIGAGDAQGFVALDHTNQLVVISFRGSVSIDNWTANLDAVMTSWSICSGCDAYAGFLDSWNSVKSLAQGAVDGAMSTYPSYSIVSTGHSLGGALATLAAADLRNSGYDIALYTYGSPMVGNLALATFITSQLGGNYRVTHANDIVPKLPSYALTFAHVSPEYWITAPTGDTVTANVIQVSTGEIDLQGDEGQLGGTVTDHLWYFNSISACSPL